MSMHITLGWWAIPLGVFIFGMFGAWNADAGSGYLAGLNNMIWFIVTMIITVALIVGHLL